MNFCYESIEIRNRICEIELLGPKVTQFCRSFCVILSQFLRNFVAVFPLTLSQFPRKRIFLTETHSSIYFNNSFPLSFRIQINIVSYS
jgi:hypothetical protein